MLEAIDKSMLLAKLVAELRAELEQALRAQRTTQEGATHEESRPENDKDTRALESTYLARGLSERVVALENGVAAVTALKPRVFTEEDPVALGAVVAVEFEGVQGPAACYYVSAAGAGRKFELQGITIQTLTPKSPLGSALVGRYVDDEVEYRSPQGIRRGCILELR